MEVIRKINDELAIAGFTTFQQWQQLAQQGFQSVLTLRSLDNQLLNREQQRANCLGLYYVYLPIDREVMCTEVAIPVLYCIEQLPKPALVCCNNAMLSAAMVLMYIAMRQGEPLQQAFQRAEKLGLFEATAGAIVTSLGCC